MPQALLAWSSLRQGLYHPPGLLTWHGFFTLILLLVLLQLDEAGLGQGGDTGDLGQAAGKGPGPGRILALQQELAAVDDVGTCQK